MPVRSPSISRVPVWAWRALMAHLAPGELRRFSAEPIEGVNYRFDIDYVGDGMRRHTLDVIAPKDIDRPLPVYVYFHGGGWTSGDKAPLTRYCATQAAAGMVVVNVNYRMAPSYHMAHMLQDANAAVAWVAANIASFGGDPAAMVIGGDSAGAQLSALLTASCSQPELAAHYNLRPVGAVGTIRGLVQHCGAVDFSVVFEKGFIMGFGFVKMLLPGRGRGMTELDLRPAARFLSPIEWVGERFPPVFVSTSRLDFFYQANLNFIAALRRHRVPVESLIDDRARHTWQQDSRHPASQPVYGRLQDFVRRVASGALAAT